MGIENKHPLWPERDPEAEREELRKIVDSEDFKELIQDRWYPLPFYQKNGLTHSDVERKREEMEQRFPAGERVSLKEGEEVISTGEVISIIKRKSLYLIAFRDGKVLPPINFKAISDRHLPPELQLRPWENSK